MKAISAAIVIFAASFLLILGMQIKHDGYAVVVGAGLLLMAIASGFWIKEMTNKG